ncbi:hypothetical protein PG994_011928 [Apiospora phragmitis]|uniref:SIMPL domain-containing protein n=1 Tax=Apiospora phragmitis TaxID=2905665 RepID=A0ABR1TUG3_9PEZI
MWPQLKIHVNGSGSVFRTAERGVLHIRVSMSSKSQQEASDGVRETSARLTAKFRAHALKTEGADGRPTPHPDAGITAFTASSLSTDAQPEYEWVEGRRRDLGITYRASSGSEVVFRDLALLAEAAAELASMPHVAIVSTEWRLTAATRAEIEREARTEAIENAVQKAQDYSGVVGRTVVAVDIQDGPASAANSITNSWRPFGTANPAYSGGSSLFGNSGQMMQQQQQMPASAQQQTQMLQRQQAQAQAQAQASQPEQANDGPSVEPRTITASAMVNVKFISVDGEPVDV